MTESKLKLSELGEFGFIARREASIQKRDGVLVGIGDDAAILSSLQTPLVTCDALIENVHFRRDWSTPEANNSFLLGRKAMSVSVSDLAAKGARPIAAFISLGVSQTLLQQECALAWLDALYDGMEDAASQHDFTIAGGDTTRTQNEIMISVTLIGEVDALERRRGAPILRSGARAGDAVLVTGTLGDATAGLFLLEHPEIEVAAETREYLIARHLNPAARASEMQAALYCGGRSTPAISAGLDLSDGLSGDASHIARQSDVQIQIEVEKLPISTHCHQAAHAAREAGFDVSAENWALCGGEDYELLWCADADKARSLAIAVSQATSTPVTRVGRCGLENEKARVVLIRAGGKREIAARAWTHF